MLTCDAGHARRQGLTVIEVVIGLSVILVLSALATVSTVNMRRERRVNTDAETLKELTAALHKFDTVTTFFPRSLLSLTTRPVSTDDNSCSVDLGATAVTAWVTSGPFWSQPISGNIPLETGTLSTTLTRVGATTPATVQAILQMSITNVEIDDAISLNEDVDGDAVTGSASTTGIVQFPAPTSGYTTVTWNLSIRGC